MNDPRSARRWWWSVIALVVVLALGACAGPGGAASPTTAGATAGETTGSGASPAEGCIDAETAAIIQSLRDDPANAQSTIDERGGDLLAGLQRFTPPAEVSTWREELLAAIESRDAAAVQALVQSIGSEVVVEFC